MSAGAENKPKTVPYTMLRSVLSDEWTHIGGASWSYGVKANFNTIPFDEAIEALNISAPLWTFSAKDRNKA